jgi:transcription elongation factor Elf1
MATKVKRQICECKNCGNEAEMEITCTLPDAPEPETTKEKTPHAAHQHVKGTATCTNCGNEADMWIDI